MCRLISFFHNPNTGSIKVWNLTGHSETQEHLSLGEKHWREGHYLPDDTIECRVLDTDKYDQNHCDERMRGKFPTFALFFNWCLSKDHEMGGNLNLRGCDLKGIKLPESVGGGLDLSGCDLKGIKLPESVGGCLDLRGCDLKGIKLLEKFKHKTIR